MNEKFYYRLVLKKDTGANWLASDYVPLEGEPCYDTTNLVYKIGNGTDLFKDLPAVGADVDLTGLATETYVDSSITTSTTGLATETYVDTSVTDNDSFLKSDTTITVGPSGSADYVTLTEALEVVQSKPMSSAKGSKENGATRSTFWTIQLEAGDIDMYSLISDAETDGQIRIENQLNQVKITGNADGTTRLVSPAGTTISGKMAIKVNNCSDIKLIDILEIDANIEFSRSNFKIINWNSPIDTTTIPSLWLWPVTFGEFQMNFETAFIGVATNSTLIANDITITENASLQVGRMAVSESASVSMSGLYIRKGIIQLYSNASIRIGGNLTIDATQTQTVITQLVDDSAIICSNLVNNSTQLLGATLNEVNGTGSFITDGALSFGAGGASELEKVTETYKTGWRLLGESSTDHIGIGSDALDFSFGYASEGVRISGASGARSAAFGRSTRAEGKQSLAQGDYTTASGIASHAEGYKTTASGDQSHAEGFTTIASNYNSHAEGQYSEATARAAHAEGQETIASGGASHAEGYNTTASGYNSHAEGSYSSASAYVSHAEGYSTTASASYAHSEGNATTASGENSHAEGYNTTASGFSSSSTGTGTLAAQSNSFAAGGYTQSQGWNAAAFGWYTEALGENSLATGNYTKALNNDSHAMGAYNIGTSLQTLFEFGVGANLANKNALEIYKNGRVRAPELTNAIIDADTDGLDTGLSAKTLITKEYLEANAGAGGFAIVDEGNGDGYRVAGELASRHGNIGLGAVDASAMFFDGTWGGATGSYSVAMGYSVEASGDYGSFACGYNTKAQGQFGSFASGQSAYATGYSSHAEGNSTVASGRYSHAEGDRGLSVGDSSHAEGIVCEANGAYSHAEGNATAANGAQSHAEGLATIAQNASMSAAGKFNVGTSLTTIHETGIGTTNELRANAFEIHTDGMIVMPNLPTADPVVAGALWNDAGVLKISAGV